MGVPDWTCYVDRQPNSAAGSSGCMFLRRLWPLRFLRFPALSSKMGLLRRLPEEGLFPRQPWLLPASPW
jgi:hypothetical protein